MNSKLIAATVLALSALAATSAFADDRSQQIPYSTATNTTRVAVLADATKARADGSMLVSNETGEFKVAATPATSTLSRADVKADYAKARAEGNLQISNETGEFNTAAQRSTRSPVMANSSKNRAAGNL